MKKQTYTYLIKSEHLNMDGVHEVFAERGNWYVYDESNDVTLNFLFKDGKYMKDPKLYDLKSMVTNIMDKSRTPHIYSKDSLYDIFMNYDKKLCKQFMVRQYNITNKNYQRINKEIFDDKIWILKAVMSNSGKDVHIIDSYDKYINFFKNMPKLNRWVLAEYINDPLTAFGRKFHIRVYFMATSKKDFYYQTNGFIITAEEEYFQGDYVNKKIHDTHQDKSIPDLFFPDGLEIYPTDKLNFIRAQIHELCYHIGQMFSGLKCYSESIDCFEIFGIDIMVKKNFTIKLIEINMKQSWLKGYSFAKNYMRGIAETILDENFPPANKVENTHYFTKVTPQFIGTTLSQQSNIKSSIVKPPYSIIGQDGDIQYTYKVYTDSINKEIINQLFNSRGNWIESSENNATFIFSYYKYNFSKERKTWNYKSYIINKTKPNDRQVINKSSLYHIFKNYDPEIAKKYLPDQYDININNFDQIISQKEFIEGKIWILKPVYSFAGRGIFIFTNYQRFLEFLTKEKSKYNALSDREKAKKKWVLSKYIDNPLLYQDKKFHFRVPYLFFENQGYVGKKFSIITAKKKYIHDDYYNKDIHDTHVTNSMRGLQFPRDFNSELVDKIFSKILNLFHHITKMMQSGPKIECYPESIKCFEVNGADIIITENLEVKLLEINNNAGFTGLVEEIFDGALHTIIDKILPPKNIPKENDFFVCVTNFNNNILKSNNLINNMDHIKYRKYKLKYLKLKKQNEIKKNNAIGGSGTESNIEHSQFINKNKNSDDYPLYSKHYHLDRTKFLELIDNFEPVIINHVPEKMAKKRFVHKYNGKYVLIEENWEKNEELNDLTDYFTEECRIKCTFGKHETPLEYWSKQKKNIANVTNLRQYIYDHAKLCNNFRISVALTILDYFKAKKWLDISAGWGDRLIAAIGHNVDLYCAVDPNDCLYPKYKNIIDTLVLPKDKEKFIIIKDGFETASLPNTKFDLVFSSPPFFDLEIYSESVEDSVVKYQNVDRWYDEFLMVSLKKAYRYMEIGGNLVLYMGEGINTYYIKNMIRDMSKIMKYEGIIYYFYPHRNIPRPLYVWVKVK